MNKFGMDQNLLRWINSFLNERSISIKIKDIKSDFFTPNHRVPQGIPLSPILFIIYVSDIPQSQFADDIASGPIEERPLCLNVRSKNT